MLKPEIVYKGGSDHDLIKLSASSRLAFTLILIVFLNGFFGVLFFGTLFLKNVFLLGSSFVMNADKIEVYQNLAASVLLGTMALLMILLVEYMRPLIKASLFIRRRSKRKDNKFKDNSKLFKILLDETQKGKMKWTKTDPPKFMDHCTAYFIGENGKKKFALYRVCEKGKDATINLCRVTDTIRFHHDPIESRWIVLVNLLSLVECKVYDSDEVLDRIFDRMIANIKEIFHETSQNIPRNVY